MTEAEANYIVDVKGREILSTDDHVVAISVVKDEDEFRLKFTLLNQAGNEYIEGNIDSFLDSGREPMIPGLKDTILANLVPAKDTKGFHFFNNKPKELCESRSHFTMGPIWRPNENSTDWHLLVCHHSTRSLKDRFYFAWNSKNKFGVQANLLREIKFDANYDLAVAKIDMEININWLSKVNIFVPESMRNIEQIGCASKKLNRSGIIASTNSIAKIQGPKKTDSNIHSHLIEIEGVAGPDDSGAPVVFNNDQLMGMVLGGSTYSNQYFCNNFHKIKLIYPEIINFDQFYLAL